MLRGNGCLGLRLLRRQHAKLPGRCLGLGVILGQLRDELRAHRLELFRRLGGGGAAFQQALLSGEVAGVLLQRRGSRGDDRTGALHIGCLELMLSLQRLGLSRRSGDIRLGLGDRCLVVDVDDLGKQLSAVHVFVILHRKLADIARYLAGNRRDVGL